MSEWTPQVIRISDISKLPNSDTLGLVRVFDAYDAITKLGEFLPGDLAAYIPIDTDVDTTRPEFAFLAPRARKAGKCRIRAMKLRGTFSQGLLIPAPPGMGEGSDPTEVLGLEKYLPPSEREKGLHSGMQSMKKARKSETWPFEKEVWVVVACLSLMVWAISFSSGSWALAAVPAVIVAAAYWKIIRNRKANRRPGYAYYDVTSILRAGKMFEDGEEVVLTVKVHGSQMSCVHTGPKGRFNLKSRTVWRSMDPKTVKDDGFGFSFDQVWSLVAKKYDLEAKLLANPNMVVFGEIYGDKIQRGFRYGCPDGEQRLAVFDVMELDTRRFLDHDEFVEFCTKNGLPMVPVLYRGPWEFERLKVLAEGRETEFAGADHPREGWVARTIKERHHPQLGRAQGKYIGQDYLLSKTEDE